MVFANQKNNVPIQDNSDNSKGTYFLDDPKLKTIYGHKKVFKNATGEIHVGMKAPKEFVECKIEDVKNALENLKGKKLWRCNVCNDLAISTKPLEVCPTCFQADAYVEINEKEFRGLLQI